MLVAEVALACLVVDHHENQRPGVQLHDVVVRQRRQSSLRLVEDDIADLGEALLQLELGRALRDVVRRLLVDDRGHVGVADVVLRGHDAAIIQTTREAANRSLAEKSPSWAFSYKISMELAFFCRFSRFCPDSTRFCPDSVDFDTWS